MARKGNRIFSGGIVGAPRTLSVKGLRFLPAWSQYDRRHKLAGAGRVCGFCGVVTTNKNQTADHVARRHPRSKPVVEEAAA